MLGINLSCEVIMVCAGKCNCLVLEFAICCRWCLGFNYYGFRWVLLFNIFPILMPHSKINMYFLVCFLLLLLEQCDSSIVLFLPGHDFIIVDH